MVEIKQWPVFEPLVYIATQRPYQSLLLVKPSSTALFMSSGPFGDPIE